MTVEAFAAARSARLERADKEMRPFVVKALDVYGDRGMWDDTVEAAAVLWLEIFKGEAPDAIEDTALANFQKALAKALKQTSSPDELGNEGSIQVDRITTWIGTYAVNDATYHGHYAAGTKRLMWVAMDDGATRPTHRQADRQVRSVADKFDVGAAKLQYPGDPTGPLDEIMGCRCLLAPAGRRTGRSSAVGDVKVMLAEGGKEYVIPKAEFDRLFKSKVINGFSLATADPEVDEEGDGIHVDDSRDEDGEPVDVEEDDDELDEVEVPWHAVMAPEGVATGDGRMFAEGALSMRDLPLPILYQHATSPDGHGGSVRVGVIQEAYRHDESGTWRARGVFNGTEEAQHVIAGIVDGSIRGVSVDVDDVEIAPPEPIEGQSDEDAMMEALFGGGVTTFSKARIAGFTIVAIPAFQEAYIGLGEAFDDELTEEDQAILASCGCAGEASESIEEYSTDTVIDLTELTEEELDAFDAMTPEEQEAFVAEGHLEVPLDGITAAVSSKPGTHDGPGWLTNPRETARLRKYWTKGPGAAKIRWGTPGDFNRCRKQLAKYVRNPEYLAGTCANMHKAAIGIWPGQETGKGNRHHSLNPDAMMSLVASAAPKALPAEWFKNPELDQIEGVIIEGDHIFGYLATWNVCHIGIADRCEMAPHSPTNYAYYRTGVVQTDDGPVKVGQITMGTGHASLRENARTAAAHYDNTGSAVADVVVGEDGTGIWFSGSLRRTTTEDQRFALAATGRLSGDWRSIGGVWELIASLAVNVPGYPLPSLGLVASGEFGADEAMVAVGIVPVDEALVASATARAQELDELVRATVEETLAQVDARSARASRLAALQEKRATVRSHRAASARARIERG